MILSDDLL